MTPRVQNRTAVLPADVAGRFAELRRSIGRDRLAVMLGCGTAMLEQLDFGGRAEPAAVERVAAAVRGLR